MSMELHDNDAEDFAATLCITAAISFGSEENQFLSFFSLTFGLLILLGDTQTQINEIYNLKIDHFYNK